MIFYYFIQRYYISTSRQLKRLESVSRSPIYNQFSETLNGVATIRAFGREDIFIAKNEGKVDRNARSYWYNMASNRLLSIRLELLDTTVVFFSCIFATISRDDLEAATVGLSITYAIQITQTLNWWVRQQSEVETNIVSVERMVEYTDVDQEAEAETDLGTALVENGWPCERVAILYTCEA